MTDYEYVYILNNNTCNYDTIGSLTLLRRKNKPYFIGSLLSTVIFIQSCLYSFICESRNLIFKQQLLLFDYRQISSSRILTDEFISQYLYQTPINTKRFSLATLL